LEAPDGGEAWKLDAFRKYDTFVLDASGARVLDAKGEPLRAGPDLYCVAYANAFKTDAAKIAKHERQIGKVMELMLQYEGGVGAYVTGAATYGIDLAAMAAGAIDAIPADVLEDAEGFYGWTIKEGRQTFGLSEQVFVVCDAFKRLWRRAHPGIAGIWKSLKEAVADAYLNPGTTFRVGRLALRVDAGWLRIRLPSGRYLCYPGIQVRDGQISYMGRNIYTKQWTRVKTYGGKLFENIVQAIARDVLASSMAPAEAAGYEIVLHVHDELVTEAPDSDAYGVDALAAIMARAPDWAAGMPLAAAGFETRRYYKES
jgi:DNA polymerase